MVAMQALCGLSGAAVARPVSAPRSTATTAAAARRAAAAPVRCSASKEDSEPAEAPVAVGRRGAMSVAIGSAIAVVIADVAGIGGSMARPAPAAAAVLAGAGDGVVLVVVGLESF